MDHVCSTDFDGALTRSYIVLDEHAADLLLLDQGSLRTHG